MTENKKDLAEAKKLFEHINENIFVLNKNKKIIFVNEKAKTLTGHNTNELIGKTLTDLVPQDHLDKVNELFSSQFEVEEIPSPFSINFKGKNESLIPLEISFSLIPWKRNKFILMIARRKSEQKLLEEELSMIDNLKRELNGKQIKLLLKAIENSKDIIVITNKKGKVLYANPASFQKHDAEREDYLNQSIFKWFAPYELERARKVKKEVEEKGYISNKKFDVFTKGGSLIHVEISAVSLKDKRGKVIGFAAIIRDITERKDMEKKLKEVLFELEIINRTILMVNKLIDVDKICSVLADAVHSLNKQCFIGVSFLDEELESIRIRSIVGLGENRKKVLDKVQRYSRNLIVKTDDIGPDSNLYTSRKLKHLPDGLPTLSAGTIPKKVYKEIEEILDIEHTYYMGFAKGKNPIGGIILCVPEGEQIYHPEVIETLANHVSALLLRRQAEKKLKRSEKRYRKLYEKVNFYKDLLAHDIANILNKIGMGVEYAELKFTEDEVPETLQQLIEVIKTQVDNGEELISKIRKLSKIRKKELEKTTVNSLETLREVIRGNPLFHQENISVSIDMVTDEKKVVAGPFLKEVFENLLTNAVQHNNSENSWVKVKISEYNRENKDYLKLDFIDNGRGIPNNIKDKIFSQGFKGQQTTNGMGIGLSLVKTILEAYNGNIWVKNRVEGNYKEGSIFSIILPKA